MARYYLQEMPDMSGKGKRKVYPKIQINRQIEMEELVERIQDRSGVYRPGVVNGILMTLADALVDYLSLGYNVKVKGLGNFSLSLEFTDDKSNEMENGDSKMNYRRVSVKDINLKSDKELVKRIKERTSLERCMREVNKLEPETFPRNIRLQRALAFIDKHGGISLYQYCRINWMSRSSASRELNIFSQDPESGIIGNGNAPHKTWVRDRSSNG
jgi:predicted histone-like DNA-binding protein